MTHPGYDLSEGSTIHRKLFLKNRQGQCKSGHEMLHSSSRAETGQDCFQELSIGGFDSDTVKCSKILGRLLERSTSLYLPYTSTLSTQRLVLVWLP